ncbi:aminopeptidase N-like [Arctopsyche grandis]|uniref:aminopeptidase N-like n=1 Tax=Arctopsyche grandis TaxID=121162 RepID=UPI00406D6338
MMEHILGTAIFRQGLHNYLKSNPLGLAEPQKLFDGLQAAADGKNILPDDLTVTDIFGIWSTQPGYPLVTATSGNNGSIMLKQSRFHKKNITSSEKWWIPITWVTSKGGDFENTLVQRWFSPNDTVLNIPLELDEDSWFIFNKQGTGYYRVMYDDKNWKLLTEALKANLSSIHLLNRVQLVDDSLELARTLRLNYTTAFDLLFHLKEETDYIPWWAVLPRIKTLSLMMPAATNFNKYTEFLLQITNKVYQSIGFEPKPNDDYITRMKRNVILDIACNAGNNDCRKNSNRKLELLTQNYNATTDPDVKDSVYCSGFRDATEDLWKFFWNKYINSTSDSEKDTILTYLACSEDVTILQDYLMLTVTNNSGLFDSSHRYTVVKSVINSGHVGVDQAVKFITTNFPTIKSIMPMYTVSIINQIANFIVTKENLDQFNEFVKTGDFTRIQKKAAVRAQSVIAKNKARLDRILPDIDPWLLKNVISSSTFANKI